MITDEARRIAKKISEECFLGGFTPTTIEIVQATMDILEIEEAANDQD